MTTKIQRATKMKTNCLKAILLTVFLNAGTGSVLSAEQYMIRVHETATVYNQAGEISGEGRTAISAEVSIEFNQQEEVAIVKLDKFACVNLANDNVPLLQTPIPWAVSRLHQQEIPAAYRVEFRGNRILLYMGETAIEGDSWDDLINGVRFSDKENEQAKQIIAIYILTRIPIISPPNKAMNADLLGVRYPLLGQPVGSEAKPTKSGERPWDVVYLGYNDNENIYRTTRERTMDNAMTSWLLTLFNDRDTGMPVKAHSEIYNILSVDNFRSVLHERIELHQFRGDRVTHKKLGSHLHIP